MTRKTKGEQTFRNGLTTLHEYFAMLLQQWLTSVRRWLDRVQIKYFVSHLHRTVSSSEDGQSVKTGSFVSHFCMKRCRSCNGVSLLHVIINP